MKRRVRATVAIGAMIYQRPRSAPAIVGHDAAPTAAVKGLVHRSRDHSLCVLHDMHAKGRSSGVGAALGASFAGSAAAAEGRQDLALEGEHVLAHDRSRAGAVALEERFEQVRLVVHRVAEARYAVEHEVPDA